MDSALPRLLPQPRSARPTGSAFSIGKIQPVIFTGPDRIILESIARHTGEVFRQWLGVTLKVTLETGPGYMVRTTVAAGSLPLSRWPQGTAEAYSLTAQAAGIAATASDAAGLRWAALTWAQVSHPHADGATTPGCEILDWPRYAWRAFMVDQGRAPNSLASLKRLIMLCSLFKLNMLVFRESDDELNAIRYPGLPFGSENPFALTLTDMKKLVEFSADHGIQLVPEIESLGHAGARAFHRPELVEGGIETVYDGLCVHRRKRNLKPEDPGSYALLLQIYEAWFPILGHGVIHLGMDEVRLPESVQARHLAGVLDILDDVATHSGITPLQPIVWADAPLTPAQHRSRVVRAIWCYAEHNNIGGVRPDGEHMVRQRYPQLAQSGCTEQFLMAGGSGTFHLPYLKNGTDISIENLADWARLGSDKANCRGLLAVQWGGNTLDMWLPEFLACADFGWNVPGPLDLTAYLPQVHERLLWANRLYPSIHEAADEHTWDGIRIKDGDWFEDIVTGKRRGQ